MSEREHTEVWSAGQGRLNGGPVEERPLLSECAYGLWSGSMERSHTLKTVLRVRLQRKIQKLTRMTVALGTKVEENLKLAVRALDRKDAQMAAQVIDTDSEIDWLEVELEEECLEVLALHQPAAGDLRYIIAILKINQDLERIGDLSVNIAETATLLASPNSIEVPQDYFELARKTQSMLQDVLDSFVNMSADGAFYVLSQDDAVDMMKHKLHGDFERRIKEDPDNQRAWIHLFLVSRHLERIADQATNIAEDIIYMTTGEIVRHGGRAQGPPKTDGEVQ